MLLERNRHDLGVGQLGPNLRDLIADAAGTPSRSGPIARTCVHSREISDAMIRHDQRQGLVEVWGRVETASGGPVGRDGDSGHHDVAQRGVDPVVECRRGRP